MHNNWKRLLLASGAVLTIVSLGLGTVWAETVRPIKCRDPLASPDSGCNQVAAPSAPAETDQFLPPGLGDPISDPVPGLQPGTARAVILIDRRMYAQVKTEIDEYVEAASKRRGYAIILDANKQLDDAPFTEIRELLKRYKQANSRLEGALFIGNIKFPSFYKYRTDSPAVSILPAYYENLDLQFSRSYEEGALDPFCLSGQTEQCQSGSTESLMVPAHDFDTIGQLSSSPDIWTAYMPVGGAGNDTYWDFGDQIRPYLHKVLAYYRGEYRPEQRTYMVSNDFFRGEYDFWSYYSDLEQVDFYAMNPDPRGTIAEGTPSGQYCLRYLPEDNRQRSAAECYQRVPLEDYSSVEDFLAVWEGQEWMGENWQTPEIFTSHMQSNSYEFVAVNVHSSENRSILDSAQARTLQHGGMIMLTSGCSVGGLSQSGTPSPVTTEVTAGQNILLSYLYGHSDARSALGAVSTRGHNPYNNLILEFMKNDGNYLGEANFRRMSRLYQQSASIAEFAEALNEILYGDPFVDTGMETTGQRQAKFPPSLGTALTGNSPHYQGPRDGLEILSRAAADSSTPYTPPSRYFSHGILDCVAESCTVRVPIVRLLFPGLIADGTAEPAEEISAYYEEMGGSSLFGQSLTSLREYDYLVRYDDEKVYFPSYYQVFESGIIYRSQANTLEHLPLGTWLYLKDLKEGTLTEPDIGILTGNIQSQSGLFVGAPFPLLDLAYAEETVPPYLSAIEIKARSADKTRVITVSTDLMGEYLLRAAPGQYSVSVNGPHYQTLIGTWEAVAGQIHTVNFNMTAAAPGTAPQIVAIQPDVLPPLLSGLANSMVVGMVVILGSLLLLIAVLSNLVKRKLKKA